MFCHRLLAVTPPRGWIEEIRRSVVEFWSGRHWVRAAVLYLSEEGGQRLVDIVAKMASSQLSWTGDNPGLRVFKEPLFPQHSVSETHSRLTDTVRCQCSHRNIFI